METWTSQPAGGASRRGPVRPRWRWGVERLALLLVGILVMRTWYFEGLFVHCQVVSGSMAETLRGVHRVVACTDCGHRFACGADVRPVRSWAVCPNCGYAASDLGSQPDVAGDRLLLDKATYGFRPPRRWELVAFRHPERVDEICVKRVVGLPGESVQLRDGDVYADGRIQRKTLAQQRALAVLVYDANLPPRRNRRLPPRWDDDQPGTGWGSADGRFFYPSAAGAKRVTWLSYRHWRRVPGEPEATQEAPITDECGYNQTTVLRAENIHPVPDVLLSFRLARTFGHGRLFVRATDGREDFQVRIDPVESRYRVYRNGRPLASDGRGELPERAGGLRVEVSLFDRQFLLAFEGRVAVVYPYEWADSAPVATSRPVAIGSQGLGVELWDLRVYRDVYYGRPVGARGRWGSDKPVGLGSSECFVLGDNSPVSEDSRTWVQGPAVGAKLILGKPFLVHFPARRIDLGPWHFQVPDPARIRYIR